MFDEIYGIGTDELHSLMILKDGKVVYEKYAPGHDKDELHICWSASKTFTATAVGFAQQEGLLNVNDPVLKYFDPSEYPAEPSEWLKNMTIKDLLIMSSGFEKDIINDGNRLLDHDDWVKTILNYPIVFEPGSKYKYNSGNTYLCSVIVSRVTGQLVEDYLKTRLFDPLGIEDYYWYKSPEGYNVGGWGLHINLESLAKMGQFFLNKGTWNGKRLLSEEWIEEASSCHIMQTQNPTPEQVEAFKTDDKQQGYGYQMWMCCNGGFRLDGAHGQYCWIYPHKDAVVACFSHSSKTVRIRNYISFKIYPVL